MWAIIGKTQVLLEPFSSLSFNSFGHFYSRCEGMFLEFDPPPLHPLVGYYVLYTFVKLGVFATMISRLLSL